MKPILLLAVLAGCSTTLRGRAEDQNPLSKPDHISEGIAIPTKDAQVIASAGEAVGDPGNENKHRTPDGRVESNYAAGGASYMHPTFHQTAYFQAPNSNQVVFIVELQNRWRELTHAENYEVTLIDDLGRKFMPAEVRSTNSHVVFAGMVLARTDVVHMVVFSSSAPGGAWVFTHNEGDQGDSGAMMGARSLLEFRGDNIVTPSTKRLVLRLYNRNRSLEFVWDFKK